MNDTSTARNEDKTAAVRLDWRQTGHRYSDQTLTALDREPPPSIYESMGFQNATETNISKSYDRDVSSASTWIYTPPHTRWILQVTIEM